MCNGHNHPLNCQCGWGGGARLARNHFILNDSDILAMHLERLDMLKINFEEFRSFTNPNARCPVCGASVYFYQSAFGGRVFFDQLGPPWPKHACTDNGTIPFLNNSKSNHLPSWFDHGWRPFRLDQIKNVGLAFKISGTTLDLEDPFQIKRWYADNTEDLSMYDLLYIRRVNKGVVEISYFNPKSHEAKTVKCYQKYSEAKRS